MATYRFTVNVPNSTRAAAKVQLRLRRSKPEELEWLPRRRGIEDQLTVINAGIALDACASKGKSSMRLTLPPLSSADVHVVINTAATPRRGVAAFHVLDTRAKQALGGVMVVCAEPPLVDGPVTVVSPPNPCPIILAADLYTIRAGSNPSKSSSRRAVIPGGQFELVAAVRNPTRSPLSGCAVYLEHLGASNTIYLPGTWNIGDLSTKDIFYATWAMQPSKLQTQSFGATVVAMSDRTDAVRLHGIIAIGKG
jgi:hypothetical protein